MLLILYKLIHINLIYKPSNSTLMKNILTTTIMIFLCFSLFGQTAERVSSQDNFNKISVLEKSNQELKENLWALNQELKNSAETQKNEIDSLINFLNKTYQLSIQNSDSLSNTGIKLLDLEENTETESEEFDTFIWKNRIHIIVILLIIILFNIIIFYILRRKLNSNYRNTQVKFDNAYTSFDEDIKGASALLNKHIKEMQDSLDQQIKTTNKSLEDKLNATSETIDKKITDTKQILDQEVSKTKKSSADEIKKAQEVFSEKIKATNESVSEELKGTKDYINRTINKNIKDLDSKIDETKKALDNYIKKAK